MLGGGLLNKLDAATNAALAPLIEPHLAKGPETLDQPTWGERYRRSLEIQNARDAKFAGEHPVVDTAAKLTGGVASVVPLVRAAPALMGAAGTLPQMVTRGAGSGAALSAADAATRGEDVVHGAEFGAGFGAGGRHVLSARLCRRCGQSRPRCRSMRCRSAMSGCRCGRIR
jgi:hypothetical protein